MYSNYPFNYREILFQLADMNEFPEHEEVTWMVNPDWNGTRFYGLGVAGGIYTIANTPYKVQRQHI